MEQSARREPGFSFDSSVDVNLLPGNGGEGADFAPASSAIRTIGVTAIANKMRLQRKELHTDGMPKTFEIYNRAELGNVKYWSQGFDSVMYPEGATDDRSTWLGPGERAILPLDAVLHFFGNIFHPTFQSARNVIEACGGFKLEPRGEQHPDAKNIPEARIIGGPLFLPDFIITARDGRARVVGEPFKLYEVYDKLTRRLQKHPILQNESLKHAEADLLEERLAEYRDADVSIYDRYGAKIEPRQEEEPCDCSPIAHVRGVYGCRANEIAQPPKAHKRRGRRPIDDEASDEQDLVTA